MDAILILGGTNAVLWGLRSLARGFPWAAAGVLIVHSLDLLPERTAWSPPWAARASDLVALAVGVDALQFMLHRLSHWPTTAPSHAVHHAHTHPTPRDAFHTGAFDAVFQLLIPIFACVWCVHPLRGSLILFGAMYSSWLQFIHTRDCRWRSRIFVTPSFHAVHHAHPSRNFGHLLTIWDRACGTARAPPPPPSSLEPPAYTLHPIVREALSGLCEGIVPPHCVGIHGHLYDAAELLDDHPGGSAWIAVVRGTDATALFESMHVDQARARARLAALPCRGTFEPAAAVAAWDYGPYRRVADVAAREVLGSRAARCGTAESSRRFVRWACVVALLHGTMMCESGGGLRWAALCVLSGLANSVLGGMGHNYLHRMDARSLALDWNGLSSFEWCLEHVASHHPMPNTSYDHDSISMSPFVSWLRPRRSNVLIYPIFCVGEIVVALQGNFGHRCRWKAAGRRGVPAWMQVAPWIFVVRVASHVAVHGVAWGLAGALLTLGVASFYFSLLAHLNHAPQAAPTTDFLAHQLGSTHDLCTPRRFPELALGLDRQTLHHLFPSVDHSRLDGRLRGVVARASRDATPLPEPRTIFDLWRAMHARLLRDTAHSTAKAA